MDDDFAESFVYLVWCVISCLYILSPVDIIPDFIPVLGYLDDIAVGISGIAAALRAIAITLPLMLVVGVVLLIMKAAHC